MFCEKIILVYNKTMINNRILIVDDTPSWSLFHTQIIKELYGNLFEITTCDSAFNALNLIKQNLKTPFNIIISDLQMENAYENETAGEWLVKNIKTLNEYNYSKIVVISGMYNIEKIAQNLGVDCIPKSMLLHNKLLMKYMFEKLMPFLAQI